MYLHKLFSVLLLMFIIACNEKDKKSDRPSFENVQGIKFIETRREFDTGLCFSEQGFQQVPEWVIYFLPGDSVKIYSPDKKRYVSYPIYFDHKNVINFAREWLRVIHLTKDSLEFQLLRVQGREVNRDLSKVYMRFYSENYIKNVLKSDTEKMRRPLNKDTAFVKRLIERANKYSHVSDSLFAARIPVEFQSRTEQIIVDKKKFSKDDLDYKASDEYLYPEYYINVKNAYKDFTHTFYLLVDERGTMQLGRFAVLEKEFEAAHRKVLQGITDVYLKRFLKVTPGQTLQIPHATEIMMHVRGTKD